MIKSYSCKKLEQTLHFLPDCVKFCCTCSEGAGLKIDDFSKFNINTMLNARNNFIKQLKQGKIPFECKGCNEYNEISYKKTIKEQITELFKNTQNVKISHIIIDHFKACDCSCLYCSQKKLYPAVNQNYELLPIIKNLYKANLIDTKGNLKVEFQGGNISVLSEFELLMEEFTTHNCDDLVILMNGIKYLPLLEKYCNNPKCHICISLDSGTKETFARIKSIDAFNTVIENIKKLKSKIKAQFSLKYIIVQNVNDNINELTRFLEIAKEIGNINPVILEIDYNNTIFAQEVNIPKHYNELFNFAEEYCTTNNINYVVYPHTKQLLAD